MSDFLNSVKTDLLDRRMLAALIALVVALAAAVAYGVLGGSSTATKPPAASVPASGVLGIAVNQAPASSTAKAVAETVAGAPQQRAGFAHNPFTPLPTPPVKSVKTTGSKSSGSSTKTSSTPKTPTEKTSEPTTPAKPAPEPKPVYEVSVQFGAIPSATPPTTPLTAYPNLALLAPLPSKQHAVLVFRGAVAGGKSAAFTLVGEAIIRGKATCLPSTTQCEVLTLKPGQSEQLEVLEASGQATIYELRLESIATATAATASVARMLHERSREGLEILRSSGHLGLPGMRFSRTAGVVVVLPPHAARAHAGAAKAPAHGGA